MVSFSWHLLAHRTTKPCIYSIKQIGKNLQSSTCNRVSDLQDRQIIQGTMLQVAALHEEQITHALYGSSWILRPDKIQTNEPRHENVPKIPWACIAMSMTGVPISFGEEENHMNLIARQEEVFIIIPLPRNSPLIQPYWKVVLKLPKDILQRFICVAHSGTTAPPYDTFNLKRSVFLLVEYCLWQAGRTSNGLKKRPTPPHLPCQRTFGAAVHPVGMKWSVIGAHSWLCLEADPKPSIPYCECHWE